jgi:hypothetical protein
LIDIWKSVNHNLTCHVYKLEGWYQMLHICRNCREIRLFRTVHSIVKLRYRIR